MFSHQETFLFECRALRSDQKASLFGSSVSPCRCDVRHLLEGLSPSFRSPTGCGKDCCNRSNHLLDGSVYEPPPPPGHNLRNHPNRSDFLHLEARSIQFYEPRDPRWFAAVCVHSMQPFSAPYHVNTEGRLTNSLGMS